MARKKMGAAEVTATVEPKTKPVRLDLEPDVHKLLRLAAAEADQSMAAYARERLSELLKAEVGKKPRGR